MYDSMDARLQVDSVYTDFSKPFDNVDHYILLGKFSGVGVDDGLIGLLCSSGQKEICCG